MIELPRAALTADEIAEVADFFSFGTNDLTQTTFGLSRDDAGKFLPLYVEKGILPKDPFVSLDSTASARWCASPPRRAASVKPDLKLGICGEHGGDPASIAFCEQVGLDYVSCSPYRVPVARLAAAQAALAGRRRRSNGLMRRGREGAALPAPHPPKARGLWKPSVSLSSGRGRPSGRRVGARKQISRGSAVKCSPDRRLFHPGRPPRATGRHQRLAGLSLT